MLKFFKDFRDDDTGAVTVEWVVLTAAVVGLSVATIGVIQSNTDSLTADIGTFMDAQVPAAGE